MITIKDLSRACGVSPSTVSKVLNGYSDVSQETAQLVFRTAAELGYTPNAAARLLKTNRSNGIGVLFFDEINSGMRNEFFSCVLNGLREEAESCGYDITFIRRDLGEIRMSYLEHCRYRRFDGVIIVCANFSDPGVVELAESEIPVVIVDHRYDQCGSVLSDNLNGMQELVHYVAGKGHRELAYIHGESNSVTQSRLAGFYRACESLGIRVRPEMVRPARYHDPESSARETRAILSGTVRPTCIFYPDDFSLIGGRNEIEHAGLSIPGDVSIAGYDGIVLSQVLHPVLTTIVQDADTMGRTAVRMIAECVENPKTYLPQTVKIPGRLQEGASVAQIG